ncbi:MAG: hypothetical protein E7028_10095 [Planctomycetaceae bacterium]|nr:hypothetical protein [Planctomycetaceae bacterium]
MKAFCFSSLFLACLTICAVPALAKDTSNSSFWHPAPQSGPQFTPVKTPFPLTDYHIHLRGGMTTGKAIARQKLIGLGSSVLENSGREWPLFDDESLSAFIRFNRQIMKEEGVFIPVGMQVNDRDWFEYFSPEVLEQLDFVLADTMIMNDAQGRPVRLWQSEKYVIDDEEAWMERYFAHTMRVLGEPITILANPTYLPAPLADRYEHFWTEERMKAVIDLAVKKGVALEIQAGSAFPSEKFIRMAKAAGAKFAVGTNNFGEEKIPMDRWFEMIEKCGLEESDFLRLPIERK